MKKQRTVELNSSKLDGTYKYVSKGGVFRKNSVCQFIRQLDEDTGIFLGLAFRHDNTHVHLQGEAKFEEFEIENKDKKIVDLR